MQDTKRAGSHFHSWCGIAITVLVSVFLACSVCAQNLQGQKECETLFSSAVKAEQQNDFIEAELRYEECRALAQKHRLAKVEASALHRLAVIRARSKKFSESAGLFRRAIDLDSRNALILCDYAQLHADRKDFAEAENLLKRALDVEPNNPKILFNLGSIIASQRGERQAEGLRYLKLAVGEAEAYRELARIYRSKGEINRAEFAEQKAQLAGNQPASSGNKGTSVRPQTPPEVVDRNRHELFDIEAREMIGAQQRAALPTVGQTPFIPAPVNPATPQRIANIPSETSTGSAGIPLQQIPVASPIDPFATTMRPQESASSSVRRLEPSPNAAFAQTTVRTIPKGTEPMPVMQSPGQNGMLDPFAPVQTTGNNAANNKPEMRSPLPQRSPIPNGTNPQNVSPIQVLPSGVKTYERTSAVNPLRQSSPSGAGLIDPIAEVPTVAALPSYSAVESKKMLRIDQNTIPANTESISNEPVQKTPEQSNGMIAFETTTPSSAPKAEFVPSSKQLPVRDVDVLQSPSAVAARRESSGVRVISQAPIAKGTTSQPAHTTSVHSMQSGPVTLEPESVKIIQGERGFTPTSIPNVLAFDLASKNQPTDKTSEIASVQPLEQNTSLRSIVRLPETQEADYPKTIARIAVPTVPVAAPVDPFPVLAEIRRDEPKSASTPAPVATSPSLFSQAKNITPLTQIPSAPAEVAVAQPSPFSTAEHTTVFGDVKNIEPLTPTLSQPTAVAVAQPNPFLVREGEQPKFAATPTIPTVSIPPVAELPRTIATRAPEPLPKVSPVPTQIPPHVVAVRPVPSLVPSARELPQQLPPREETGFASTRKPTPQVAASDEQPGFARSRR